MYSHQNKSQYSNDIVIQPSLQGMTIGIVADQHLSFVGESAPKKSWLRLVSSLIVTVGFFALPTISNAATYTSADIITQTNAVRVEHGLSPLTINPALEQAATAKANDMLAKNYFAHYSPSGVAPWIFFNQAHYSFTAAGENLAADYVDGRDIVPAWMSSASHRVNLLNPAYRDIGLAVVDGKLNGSDTTVVVQFFGSRQSTITAVPAPVITKTTPKVIPKTTVTMPQLTKPEITAPQTVASTVPQPSLTMTQPEPQQLLPTLAKIEVVPEVKGLTTEFIHSPIISPAPRPLVYPQVSGLILATLGLYLTTLLAAGLMNGALNQNKKVATLQLNPELAA